MQRFLTGYRPYWLLLLLSLLVCLPGLSSLPPLDRDESRFAQASHQMIESGDYVRIRFQQEARAKKPVGIYWLQSVSARLVQAEHSIWAYRLPSVAGIVVAVLLTFYYGRFLVGPMAALLGASLLAVSVLAVGEAHQAKTDAVLLACVVAAQGVLARFYLAGRNVGKIPSRGGIVVFWLAQGIGILIKGPIVPLVSALTILSLGLADRNWRWLRGMRWLTGLLVVLALVLPWALAISASPDSGFIGHAVKTDLLSKLTGGQEAHGGKPGLYLLLLSVTLWPGALFAVPGFVRAVKLRSGPSLRFLLAWIVPAWILFELIPTKLPHYVLPAYPALALLGGIAVVAGDDIFRRGWVKAYALVAALVGLVLAVAMVVAPQRLGGGPVWAALPSVAAAALLGLAPLLMLWQGQTVRAALLAVLLAVPTYAGLLGGVGPALSSLWISQRIADALPPGTPLVAANYHEPSLVFLMGTATVLTDGGGAAEFLQSTPHSVAAVEAEQEPAFRQRLGQLGLSAKAITTIRGFNYSRGRSAVVTLWDLETPP